MSLFLGQLTRCTSPVFCKGKRMSKDAWVMDPCSGVSAFQGQPSQRGCMRRPSLVRTRNPEAFPQRAAQGLQLAGAVLKLADLPAAASQLMPPHHSRPFRTMALMRLEKEGKELSSNIEREKINLIRKQNTNPV